MKYRPEIDGLRAAAILPVVFFHAGVAGFSGGFVGVDIFFVISGFLITGILDDDLRNGRFSILTFYERRFRRIIPALIFFVLLTSIAAYLLFLPSFLEDYARSLLSVGTFTSNLYFWKFSGYFENSAHLRPLLHTWSLAVEEQFYIFMPIAMWLLYRVAFRLRLFALALALVLSLALSVYATEVAPTANFFLLPTRSWELLAGSMMALWRGQSALSYRANGMLSMGGAALILYPVFTYTEATPFPGLAAVLPCAGAALIIYTGGPDRSIAGKILASSLLVFIGKISYSLYLAHWPIAVFVRYVTLEEPNLQHAIVIIAASFALAIFSWRFVETPFRRRASGGQRRSVIGYSLASLSIVAAAGYLGIVLHGLPQRFPDYASAVEARTRDASTLVASAGTQQFSGQSWRNGKCFFEDETSFQNWRPEDCALTDNPGEATLLWGDSYAAHYAPGIVANAASIRGRVYQYTSAGCPPVLLYYSYARPKCQTFNQNALGIIKSLGASTVVLSGRWVDLQLRGLHLLEHTVHQLEANGVRVIVIGQSPMFVTSVDVIAYEKAAPSQMTASWTTVIDADFNQRLRQAAGGADFVDPIATDCTEDGCPYIDNGRMLYFDSGHLSDFGSARLVARLFSPSPTSSGLDRAVFPLVAPSKYSLLPISKD